MATVDGRWTIRVGGVGSVTWYRLEGAGVVRNLPSMTALAAALADASIELGDFREVQCLSTPST
jgi:hypothetical protein